MDYSSVPTRFGEDGLHVSLNEVNAKQLAADITKGAPIRLGSGKNTLFIEPVTAGTVGQTDIGRDAFK